MSSKKPKKGLKLGSSRRNRNRNQDIEEKESDDGFSDPVKEEHDSEQSQFHTVPESQEINEASLLHSDQTVIACTNPNTSVFERTPHPQPHDLLAQAEVTSKKRKMGSTRKCNRNFKFEGIYEDDSENSVQLNENISDDQGLTVETCIKEDGCKEDKTSLLDLSAPSQSSDPEGSILKEKHLARGTITHDEDNHKNDEHQHLEAVLKSKCIGSSFELQKSKETELTQDLTHPSLDFKDVTASECNVPLQQLVDSLQLFHQMDTFSEPVSIIPNTDMGQKSGKDTTYTLLNENREERQQFQMSFNNIIHNDESSMAEHTVLKTMDEESSLNCMIIDKQEDKKEGVDTLEGCTTEDIGHDEVKSASLMNEHGPGTKDDEVATVIWQTVHKKFNTEDEDMVDQGFEHKNDTLKLAKESIYKSESMEREDIDVYKEVSVTGNRTDNDSDKGVATTNLNQAMEQDRNIFSTLKLKDQEVGTCDLSEAKCLRGESSADKEIAKTAMDMCYGKEEKYRMIGTKIEVENDDMQSTTANQLLIFKSSSANMLDFVSKSELNFVGTLYEETDTNSKTCNLQHNSPVEFPEFELQSKESVCYDQMLVNVIKDESAGLAIETTVSEEENIYINEVLNASFTESFTQENFIGVDDEKVGLSTIINEHEMASVITNIQAYPFADLTCMIVKEDCIESPSKECASPVHAYPTSDPKELISETQVILDMNMYNDIAVPDQKKLFMSEECIVNARNRDPEVEQFESTSQIVCTQESRLGLDDAAAESVSPSEKNEVDSSQRSLIGLNSTDDKKDGFKAMNETIQVQSLEISKPISEDVALICCPQSSESLNIMEPEAEIVNYVNKAVIENENTNVSQECNETRQHSTEGVKTNQESSVLNRLAEETVLVKNICERVDTTHVVLSDVAEYFGDTEVFKIKSRREVTKCNAQNERATQEADKDGQPISLEYPHQNDYLDFKLQQSKSLECTEFVTVTINTDQIMTSVEHATEVTQLPEASIIQADSTPIQEEANDKSIKEKSNDKIEATGATKNSTMEVTAEFSKQYMYSELSFQNISSSLTTIEHLSHAGEQPDFKEISNDGIRIENVQNRNMLNQTKKSEGKGGEWKNVENTEVTEHETITQAVTSNLRTEPQNTVSELTLEIQHSPMTTEQKQIINSEIETMTGWIGAPLAILTGDHNRILPVISDKVIIVKGLAEKKENQRVKGEKDDEAILFNQNKMAPVITNIHDDASIEHVSLVAKNLCNESPDNKHINEVSAHSTCGPVDLMPETHIMSNMQRNTVHLENPTNRESEPEQCSSQFVELQEVKPPQVDVIIEKVEFSSSEKRRKLGSTRKSLKEQVPGNNQENKFQAINKNIQEQNMEQKDSNTGVIVEKNNDKKEEITAGPIEHFIKQDIITACSQQSSLCELSQNTDLVLSTVEHPSPVTELSDLKEDDEHGTDNIENANAEFPMQTQTKKKNKIGSTRRHHGKQQLHAEGEEDEWKNVENPEEIEYQIISKDAMSNLLTEPQNIISEVKCDIQVSPMTHEQKQIIKSGVEIMSEDINVPPAMLSDEVHQIPPVVSDEVSNAEELTIVTEQKENTNVNEKMNGEATHLYDQEISAVITKIQGNASAEHVLLAVKNHCNESPDNEHISEVNAHSTCGPVELVPEVQAMSNMEMNTENINALVSYQNQNISEVHIHKRTNEESESEQCERTSPFVHILESKPLQADVIENVEFSSSEKRTKTGSTQKSLTGQVPGSYPKNKVKSLNEKENMQEQNVDQKDSSTVVIEEKSNDTKDEITVGPTENMIKEDITTVYSQQYTLRELSQTFNLGLTTIEHPSLATDHPDFMLDYGHTIENVENANAEIHMEIQTNKKKKFGSTRRPYGKQQNAEGRGGEWKDVKNTEATEHQIVSQGAASNLHIEWQNIASEVTLDMQALPVTTERKQIIKSEVEILAEVFDAPAALLSDEVAASDIVVSDEVIIVEGLTDIIEQKEKERKVKDEMNDENQHEMAPGITKIQDDASIEHVPLAIKIHCNERPDNEHINEVSAHSTCGPLELMSEIQAMSNIQRNKEYTHVPVSDQSQNISDEHLQNPTNRVSEPEQCTSQFVEMQESKPPQVDVIIEKVEFSSSKKRRKLGSTRRNLRGQVPGNNQENTFQAIKEKENPQEQNMEQNDTNTGVIKEKNNDKKEEITVGPMENFIKEDITAVYSEQSILCELSQTTDLILTKIEYPSRAPHHPDVKEDDGHSTDNAENRNAEIHTQTQTKKKKKTESTRQTHGKQQTVEGERGEWKDVENTVPSEHQIVPQAANSKLLIEPQNIASEVILDIQASPVTTEHKEIINSEVETVAEAFDAPTALLSDEVAASDTVVSDEAIIVEGLTDIIEQKENQTLKDEKDDEAILLNQHEMTPFITKVREDASLEHVSLAARNHCNERPDNDHNNEVSAHSTCGPVDLMSEIQVISDMQRNTEYTHVLVSDQNQNISDEHRQNPTNRESEPEQCTSQFVQLQESKPPQVDVIIEKVEFSSSEKRRKLGSTRKSLKGQVPGNNQENKFQAINKNIQEQNMEQKDSNTGVIVEKNNDKKEEITAGPIEHFIKQDIITACSQQSSLCELSQNTDLVLSTVEHPSPVTELSDWKEDDEHGADNIENANAEFPMQTQTKKNNKIGSTRRHHGKQQLHAEGKEDKWKNVENPEEIEYSQQSILCELSQTTDLCLTIIEYPSPATDHTDVMEDSIDNVENRHAEIHMQTMKNKKFGSTQRCHGTNGQDVENTEEILVINQASPSNLLTEIQNTLSELSMQNEEIPDLKICDKKTKVKEYEPETHNKPVTSEGSCLSEIEIYMNKSFESSVNTIALKPNISEFSELISEVALQLPSSQNPHIHSEPSSPARRRKIGSSRKMSRNKQSENICNGSSRSEQEKENLGNTISKDSETKTEVKSVKETVMAEGTEDMKESVELMSEIQALSQINESSTQATGQHLPEGRRKYGSRHTAKGSNGLGAFTHGDYESNQKQTDIQVTKDELRVSDPYLISELESTPMSHPVAEPRPRTEENTSSETKTVVNDTNASTEAGHVSLDNRKTSLCVVSTGGRQNIDSEQWDELIPDFQLAVYNIVMVGNSNVGKTSFIKRLQTGHFIPDYSATIGVDTFVQTVTFGSRMVKLHVWDTAGQERYHSITRQVFHKAQGLLLMYDITSSQSFNAVRAWISQVQETASPNIILMLLGNKTDCAHREVQLQQGEDLSKEYNIHFMECSAATGENVSESLKTLAWLLVKQRVRKEEEHTRLQPKPQNKKSGCC